MLGTRAPWLTGRGHVNPVVQNAAPPEVIDALAEVHATLGGDASALASKRPGNPPTPDLIHTPTETVIEIDEVQHFTSARLRTLDLYPADVPLGFNLDEYKQLVENWRSKGDRAYAHKVAADFPQTGGRQAQRAYNDALRDLLAPTFTGHPVIRIAVPDRGIGTAVARLMTRLPDGPTNGAHE